jgi:phage terminase Nu1 subunit (DNA packaging protein)
VRKALAGQALTKAELAALPQLRRELRKRLGPDAATGDGDAPPAAAAEGPVVSTLREVGECLGRGERMAQHWKADGMPVRADGRYDVGAIAAWLVREDRTRARSGGSARELREHYEAEYRRLKCELAEIRLRIDRGELIDRAVEQERIVEILREFRSRLLAVPGALAAQLVGLGVLEIKARLEARVSDALESLTRL